MGRTTRDIDMTASRSQMAIHGVIWLLCASIALVSLDPLTASAQWSLGAAGVGRAVAQTVPATATPTVSLSKQDVTVSWSATTLSGGTPVSGYVVRRYNASLVQQTILANCASVTTNSCVEQNVPTGNWTYSVQATRANWFGAESAAAPSLPSAPPPSPSPPGQKVRAGATITGGTLSGFPASSTIATAVAGPCDDTA